MTSPPASKEPETGFIKPARVFIKVVFPLPFLPLSMMHCPSA